MWIDGPAQAQKIETASAGSSLALAAIPALYLLAALLGSLIPVNPAWQRAGPGASPSISPTMASMPTSSCRRWPRGSTGIPCAAARFRRARPRARWVAFGSGEERVYLETPRWRDIKPQTVWSAMSGGQRVMHVEWVGDPSYAVRESACGRRISPAVGGDPRRLRARCPRAAQHLAHPGYGPADAFYRATGKASAIRTCNSWAADRLRLAGVKTSLWPPVRARPGVAVPEA